MTQLQELLQMHQLRKLLWPLQTHQLRQFQELLQMHQLRKLQWLVQM
jgi:hypothetical protein